MQLDRRRSMIAIVGLAALAQTALPALAKRRGREYDDDDYAAAARAREAGEIRPLTEILEHIKSAHPGEVVGVELERKKGRWVYEIKLIAPGGRFFEIYVDAQDKSTLKIEGK